MASRWRCALVLVAMVMATLAMPPNYDNPQEQQDDNMQRILDDWATNERFRERENYDQDELNPLDDGDTLYNYPYPRNREWLMEREPVEELPEEEGLAVVDDWPVQPVAMGQVGGIDSDKDGNLHVFHRADRVWGNRTFENDIFTEKDKGPITEATMLKLNRSNGAVIDKWGENMFYLPHGLTIDGEGNFWVTDVALHQVFKLTKDGVQLTLGKAFEPAADSDDEERFCKPTDVAVASNGDFFVADGYCNSRILKYNSEGELIGVFGKNAFVIPHSLALAEDLDMICVADREDKRIVCYNAGLRDPELLGVSDPDKDYMDEILGRVFGIAYSPNDNLLYAVSGPTPNHVARGYTIDLLEDGSHRDDIIGSWMPSEKGFDQPHDVAVTPDGENVYVGEIGPNVVWKFSKED